MKNVQVTINPTVVKSVNFNNSFTQKPGERIEMKVKNEFGVKMNPTNPVAASVMVRLNVEDDATHSITFQMETITSVVVSTFIDDLDEYIKAHYLPVIMMAVNEKFRSISAMIGVPINIPNPRFGIVDQNAEDGKNLMQ